MDLSLRLISKEINEVLWRTGKTISCAESCTSGRIASAITATSGASAYFQGSIVTYTEKQKIAHLGVDAQLIEQKTAVCEEVVKQMVIGANKLFGSDYSVAVSGFAGPGGPDPKTGIRVGTIWIAAGNADNLVTLQLTEDDGRERNIQRATAAALHTLLEILKQDIPEDEESCAEETA